MKEEKKNVIADPIVQSTEKETEKSVAAKELSGKASSKKTPAKKVPAKKAQVKKTEIKESVHLEFAGKSYSKEELIKSVKDIWKYDYKKKAADLSSIDLYVKPEEGKAYYVINGDVLGDFVV